MSKSKSKSDTLLCLSRQSAMADASPLLKSTPAWEDQTWWRVTHAGAFILGGVTFWIGTWLYYDPADSLGDLDQAQLSAWLYIIGSIGFLYVDVEEFFTFTDDYWLRVNIACSVTGSTLVSAAPRRAPRRALRSARSPALLSLSRSARARARAQALTSVAPPPLLPSASASARAQYIIGSVGFLPSVYAWSPLVGILGFILGSFFIGSSQIWKVVRIAQGADGNCGSADARAATCVEGGACVGGWGFFFGTIVYWIAEDDLAGTVWMAVLAMWIAGSTAFTFGGLSLAYRHFVMGIV